MFKLSYKASFTFSGRDIGDAGGPDITYQCWINRPEGFYDNIVAFADSNGQDLEAAYQIIGKCLIAISQDGERWPIGSIDQARALRDSVEAQSPGYGDEYIKNLAWAIYQQRKVEEEKRLGELEAPSPVSNNGATKDKSLSAAKQAS